MKYFFITVALILLILGGVELAAKSKHQPPVFETPNYDVDVAKFNPMVKIYTRGGAFLCTGTIISDRLLVTAYHCTAEDLAYSVKSVNRAEQLLDVKVHRVEVANPASDWRVDQGLLTGDFTAFNKMPISLDFMADLQAIMTHPLMVCGCPLGGELICYNTQAAAKSGFGVELPGFVQPGMSGGPVFSTITGEIVGLISATSERGIVVVPTASLLDNFRIERK